MAEKYLTKEKNISVPVVKCGYLVFLGSVGGFFAKGYNNYLFGLKLRLLYFQGSRDKRGYV